MPKPTIQPKYRKIESKIIEILLRGHHDWRPDLPYPQSHSDMQGAVRELMAVMNIQEIPEDLPVVEIRNRILSMIDERTMMEQVDNKPAQPMVEKRTWEAFKAVGLLWWVNRMIHIFGWAIVYAVNEGGDIKEVYPARVIFRGFSPEIETDGFIRLTEHMETNIKELVEESKL